MPLKIFSIISAGLTKGYLLLQTLSSSPNCHKQCKKTDTLSEVFHDVSKPSYLHSIPQDTFSERYPNVSHCNCQHCSLLSEGVTTGWQKSYGTNSSNSIPPFMFYMFFSLVMRRIIFHSHILCCSQQCSAKMTGLAESPFTSSVSGMKYCGVQRHQVSIVSQDMYKLTPGMGTGDFK